MNASESETEKMGHNLLSVAKTYAIEKSGFGPEWVNLMVWRRTVSNRRLNCMIAEGRINISHVVHVQNGCNIYVIDGGRF